MTNDEKQLKEALYAIKQNNFGQAEKIILNLHSKSKTDSLRKIYQMLYYDMMFIQSKWDELCKFDSIQSKKFDDYDNVMVLAKAFRISGSEIIEWSKDTSELKFSQSPTGCPIIDCYVNGNLRHFWFDTGANYSVLSAKTADECNVLPVIRQYSKALTGTSRKIDIYPATINELRIGNLLINNSPVVIVHDFDLKLKFFGSNNSTKIDGVIGWKAIQNMSVKLDFIEHKLTISKPENYNKNDQRMNERNFFWLGCPIIKLQSDSGVPLIMALDLGSEKTSITQNIFKKINFDKIYQLVKPIGSAGGSMYINSNMVSSLSCIIDSRKYEFNNIGTTFQVPPYFVNLDGIIGIDLFEESVIKFELDRGYFNIIKSRKKVQNIDN